MDQLRPLRLVIASPGDVKPEREIIPRVVDEVNRGCPTSRGFRDVGLREQRTGSTKLNPTEPNSNLNFPRNTRDRGR
jgi:hypothetical protein